MYEVLVEDKALKQLGKVPLPERKILIRKIKQLRNPKALQNNIKPLRRPLFGFRLRVGDYRILFTKDDPGKEIKVYVIARRDDAYSM